MAFLSTLALLALAGFLPLPVLLLYLGMSASAFLAYGIDKEAARDDRRRTPERTLHLLGLFGGWPGALLAQRLFRHKSSKQSFQTIFRWTVAFNCAALVWLVHSYG